MAYAHAKVFVNGNLICVHGGNNSEIYRFCKELESISYIDFCKRFPNVKVSEKLFKKTFCVYFNKT